MGNFKVVVLVALFSVALAGGLRAEDLLSDAYGVSVQTDVVYGQGRVGASGPEVQLRDLKMDVYRPIAEGVPLNARPAVIMAFGGAFHRGSRGTARFEEDGASDSAMGEYCHAFAAAGYACFSAEYRLVPEDPALPEGLDPAVLFPKATLNDPVATARVDVVRGRMGLPLLDEKSREQLWNGVFAAADDLTKAVRFVREQAGQFGVDPERVALGGFSAGALSAVNAAYGMGAPVKAVISLSGGLGGFDLRKTARPGMPPVLFVIGQNDLPAVQFGTQGLLAALTGAGIPTEGAWMPGFGHFYPMGATSLGSDMTRYTLRSRALQFLDRHLGE